MDQESFRLLLKSGSSPNTQNGSRGNLPSTSLAKSKKVDNSQPAFKPRKVKKVTADSKYRDRAAERREGGGNDYAHVEAILDDFERRNADNEDQTDVEEKRKYLGGDGEHSILVKGLDMALLEQNKARVAQEQTEDDDTLEQVYLEASTVPKKRTREDIIKELKQKRSQQDGPDSNATPESETQASVTEKEKSLEDAKKQGKFKPIGFKPIGASEEGKKKKKTKNGESIKESGERKKKKRKVENSEAEVSKARVPTAASTKEPPSIPTNQSTAKAIDPEPEPLEEDFDIFAGAGDYEGLEVDDEEDEDETEPPVKSTSQEPIPIIPSRKWIETEDDTPSKPDSSLHETNDSKRLPLPNEIRGRDPDSHDVEMEGGEVQGNEKEEEQRLMRLEALESSNLPSIRDFLAMDNAALAAEKRKKRKEKKKAGGGPKSMEAKVNRDFQRLQSYNSKKEGSKS